MRVAGSVSLLKQLMKRPSQRLWCWLHSRAQLKMCICEEFSPRTPVEPGWLVGERENLVWNTWAWNGPLEWHPEKPGLDFGKQSRRCSCALHPVLCILSSYTGSLPGSGSEKSTLWAHDPQGLAGGGNLGGAEHAVWNNWGGGIFFLLGSVKSLIYGFHSAPGLQIIPLSKQSNSWMLILQIKLTLAAFVHRGIHQGLPSPQHVSPLIRMRCECAAQPPGFLKGMLRPKET